jgi:hypothetical protein
VLLGDIGGSHENVIPVGAIGVGIVLASTAAEAKGCIKGAIVGGLGGHYVGRGMSFSRRWRRSPWCGPHCWSLAHHIGCHSRMPRGTIYGAQTRARNRAPSATFTFAVGTDSGYALAAGPSLRLGTSFAFALDPVRSLRSRRAPCRGAVAPRSGLAKQWSPAYGCSKIQTRLSNRQH